MDYLISGIVREFEEGRISRRQLIRNLSTVLLVASAGSKVEPPPAGFRTTRLDHISYQVSDYARTRDFYVDLMGMKVSSDNGTSQAVLQFGDSLLIARNRRARPGQPASPDPRPTVDHIAYTIEDWNTERVKSELEGRGLRPRLDTGGNTPNYVSFHVLDPEGFDLQISGIARPGDSQYKAPDA